MTARRDTAVRRSGIGIAPMHMLEGIYIDVTHTDILDRYGSVAAYLRDGLGLTEEELATLKDVVSLDAEAE